MFCPECECEHRDGFWECADCHVKLVHELPKKEPPAESFAAEGSAESVVVFESPVAGEADTLAAMIESQGIPTIVQREFVNGLRLGVFDPGVIPGQLYALSVPKIAEPEARAMIAELRPALAADTTLAPLAPGMAPIVPGEGGEDQIPASALGAPAQRKAVERLLAVLMLVPYVIGGLLAIAGLIAALR